MLVGVLVLAIVGAAGAAAQMLWASASPYSPAAAASTASTAASVAPVSPSTGQDTSVRTLYVYGHQLRPLVEDTGGVPTLNIYGPGGQIIAQVVQDGQGGQEVRHLLADHLGSTRAALDEEGNAVARFEYAPYGEATAAGTAAAKVRYRYTGHPYDEAQGVYETPARGYDPTLGRFLSVDSQWAGASPYVYAANNPVGYLDPTGGVEVPFFIHTGFLTHGTPNDLRSVTAQRISNALGLLTSSSHRSHSAKMFGSNYSPDRYRQYDRHMLLGNRTDPAVGDLRLFRRDFKYGERLYVVVGKERALDDMPRLTQRMESFQSLLHGFGTRVTIINVSGSKDRGETIRDKFAKITDYEPIVVDADPVRDRTYASSDRYKVSGFRANDRFYNNKDFQKYIEDLEAWRGPQEEPNTGSVSRQTRSEVGVQVVESDDSHIYMDALMEIDLPQPLNMTSLEPYEGPIP